MNVRKTFLAMAAARGWSAEQQIDVLLDYIAVKYGDTAFADEQIAATCSQGGISPYLATRATSIAPDGLLEQGRYCVLSTAHLSHTTSEWLERWSVGPPPPSPIPIASTFYGWLVATREPDVPTEPLPGDLLAAMRFGRTNGFDHILFDCDAGVVDGLPVHDW